MIDTIQETQRPDTKKSKSGQLFKQLISILLAGAFLYFAFSGANIKELFAYTHNLNPLFLGLVCLSSVLSNFCRAIRWTILLKPLENRKISLWNSFSAVMYGNAVNVILPRGGEIARLISISKLENISWIGVLPTLLIDRLLDIIMLVMFLGVTLSIVPADKIQIPWLVPVGLSMCVATFAGLFILPFIGKIISFLVKNEPVKSLLSEKVQEKILQLSIQFDIGTRCLTNPLNLPAIIFLSVSMWVFYWLNLYLMLFAFHLEHIIGAKQSLIVFAIGSMGVLIPTPGSIGSYHFLISQGLMQASSLINKDLALAFATVLHLICFVITACLPAAFCFAVQQFMKKGTTNQPSKAIISSLPE